ncbi:hypothetical protein cce_2197 [Crocosphaera subtropica ATCC 51142]|uniref:Uncharacterized protein n=1 Tax=Crocosphaera subtropica (strain ATCC 51142 / BH68) TaxID=43989 RepID=B1WPH7_CROS5|nr:hypothetical protein [Crocosphaera subtropica]ACB51547.1 hypothetical protein cce_2197 [Crocosphaera subtropica ATCC 51142]
MTLIIERIIASFLIITGLSYLFQSAVWKDLVKELLTKPTGLIFWSLLFLPWGLIVVFGHNLWVTNWTVLITIIGWLVTTKCVLYLLVPSWANFVKNWSDEFLQRYIRIAGGVETILGGVLLFLSFAG